MSKKCLSSKMDAPLLEELGKAIDFPLNSLTLLATALTHKSHANEEGLESNERLEFLGDAVLSLVVAHYLYCQFPGAPEGQLAKMRALMVSAPVLARQAKRLDLGRFLRLGRGENSTGGSARESNLANVFEAVTGSFFVQGGLEPAKTFILAQLEEEIHGAAYGWDLYDFKTRLQEELQRHGIKPIYKVTGEEGPDHDKRFAVAVHAGGRLLGQGRGRSKKEAEQIAAKQALEDPFVNSTRQG